MTLAKRARQAETAREAALQALYRRGADGAFLNLALPPLLNFASTTGASLARELATGRPRRNTLDWSLELFLKPLEKLTGWIRTCFRLSANSCFTWKESGHAAVDEAVKLARRYATAVSPGCQRVLRRLAHAAVDLPWPDSEQQPLEHLVLRYSHPRCW